MQSKQLVHSEKSKELLRIFSEMLNESIDALNNQNIQIHKLSLKQTYLLLMFGMVNSYSEAVFELCKQFRPKPTMVLLRAILEAWINVAYFLSHNSNNRLLALMMHDSFSKLGLVKEMEEFSSKYPWMLTGSILSEQNISMLRKKVEKEIRAYKKLKFQFKTKKELNNSIFFESSLLERARKADTRQRGSNPERPPHPYEHQYLVIYRFFSDFTHMSLVGTNNFIKKTSDGIDLLASQSDDSVEISLVTLFVFYLGFINKLKQYEIVSVPKLNQYNKYFNTHLGGDAG